MRDYKFRGKRLDNGEWVYGYYISRADQTHYIITMRPNEFGKVEYPVVQVDPDTVGQLTGLYTRDGRAIYEGDIIVDDEFETLPRVVFWHNCFARFSCTSTRGIGYLALSDYDAPSVIGNIHDDPELLK